MTSSEDNLGLILLEWFAANKRDLPWTLFFAKARFVRMVRYMLQLLRPFWKSCHLRPDLSLQFHHRIDRAHLHSCCHVPDGCQTSYESNAPFPSRNGVGAWKHFLCRSVSGSPGNQRHRNICPSKNSDSAAPTRHAQWSDRPCRKSKKSRTADTRSSLAHLARFFRIIRKRWPTQSSYIRRNWIT